MTAISTFLLPVLLSWCLALGIASGGVSQARPGGDDRQGSAPVAQSPAPPASSDAYFLFLRGRQLEDEGDADGAVKLFEQAAKVDPRSGDVRAEIASVYVRSHRYREAITAAEAALKINPDTTQAHLVLGNIYAMYAQTETMSTSAGREAATEYTTKAVSHLEAVLNARGATADAVLLITLGRLYLRTSAFDKAIAVISRFNEQQPGTVEGAALLADAYRRTGRTGEAISILKEAVTAEPSLYPTLADVYERAGRWGDAADAYRQASEHGAGGGEVKRRWALALLNSQRPGDADRARGLLKQMLAQDPKDAHALYLLAQAQRQAKDLAGAEATARQLMTVDPAGASGPYALAQVYEQRHEYQKVVDTLQPVADRFGGGTTTPAGADLTPLLLDLGLAYLDLDQPERAIPVLQRAKQGSDDSTIDVALVQAQMTARRYAQAVDLAEKARARHPEDLRLARLEAEGLRQSGQLDRGVSILEEVRRAHPDDPANYTALGELLMSADRHDEAATVLQQAREKFPDDVRVLFDLGALYEHQKRYDEAEKAFKGVLAKDPLDAQALNYLGYMLAERGVRLDESVGYVQRALAVEPGNPAYLDSLGWAYFKMNRLDLAQQNLQQAAASRPNDSAVQDHWGDVLLKLGRQQDAIAAWKRALAGDGEDVDRATIEAKIRSAGEKARK